MTTINITPRFIFFGNPNDSALGVIPLAINDVLREGFSSVVSHGQVSIYDSSIHAFTCDLELPEAAASWDGVGPFTFELEIPANCLKSHEPCDARR